MSHHLVRQPRSSTAVPRLLRGAVLGTVTLALSLAAQGQDPWQTVDAYQYVEGSRSLVGDIGTDAFGRVYAVGSGALDPNDTERVGLIQRSTDAGDSWATLAALVDPDLPVTHHRAFAADALGRLFVGGNARSADGSVIGWLVRESLDGGVTWTEADERFPFQAAHGSTYAGCADLKVHPWGDVYASGSSRNIGWVVRKRAQGQSAFTTLSFPAIAPNNQSAWSLAFDPDGSSGGYGSVLVVGDPNDRWTVARSGDRGATWSIVDTLSGRDWGWSAAMGVLVTRPNAAGKRCLVVCGPAYNAKSKTFNWVVRFSADGGKSWTLSENFASATARAWNIGGITEDAAGNIYVSGTWQDSAGRQHLMVRRSGPPTTQRVKQGRNWVEVTSLSWSTSDLFQWEGRNTGAGDITADALGNVFVLGRGLDAQGKEVWLVRKLAGL